MLELAWRFLHSKEPSPQETLYGLRLLFAGAFLLQLAFALLLGLLLGLVSAPGVRAGNALAPFLQALSVINLFLGLTIGFFTAFKGGKDKALAAALSLGGLLASPAWFALLLVMAGADQAYLLRLGLLLFLYLVIGWFVAGSYARFAVPPNDETETEIDAEAQA